MEGRGGNRPGDGSAAGAMAMAMAEDQRGQTARGVPLSPRSDEATKTTKKKTLKTTVAAGERRGDRRGCPIGRGLIFEWDIAVSEVSIEDCG